MNKVVRPIRNANDNISLVIDAVRLLFTAISVAMQLIESECHAKDEVTEFRVENERRK